MEMTDEQLPPRQPKWKIRDVAAVLAALALMVPVLRLSRGTVAKLIKFLEFTGSNPETISLFVGALIQAAVLILAVVVLVWRRGGRRRDLGLDFRGVGRSVAAGLAGGFILGFVVWVTTLVVVSFFGQPPPQNIERLLAGVSSGKDVLLPFLAVSVLAPLSEELYFRGMAYPVLRQRFGPVIGMLITGFFFGSLHLDLYRLAPISAMGFALAYFYERTGSLLTPIVAHSAWNTFMLVMLYAAGNLTNTG